MSVKSVSTKVIAGGVVLGVILILIFSSPAQAFTFSLQIPNNTVDQGKDIKVNVSIDTQNNDNPNDISYLIFKLTGPENTECKFLADGTPVSGCEGIDIQKLAGSDSGYCKSYGYGEGCSLKYALTINSNFFEIGTYSTSLTVDVKGKDSLQNGGSIIINIPNKVCSIRSNDGLVSVNNSIDFTTNKLNFYLPFQNAARGEGYVTSQNGKQRFIYQFTVDKVLIFTNSIIQVQISGKYRIGSSGAYTDETAVLTIDRMQNTTTIVGDKINMNGTKIYFRHFC